VEPSVILVEFNELCLSLMRRFMNEGKLPNFQKLYDESQVYVTDAEEEAPYLEPWIQWVSVHSGLRFREHQVFHLADGHALRQMCIWDILSAHNHRIWVCGSMNIRYDQPINGLVLPDPWITQVVPSDSRLEIYWKFVRKHVQEYTNDRVPLSAADYLRFAFFMMTHGLSFDTVRAVANQLLSERHDHNRWKRAVILDKIQFDVFAHYFRELKPHFSTFFLNSTAHFQHLYWRNMEPDLFSRKPSAEEQNETASAIQFGYEEMDGLLGRLYELADSNTTLIFCTALSQQPCLKYEALGGKLFYRPRHFESLLEFAGVSGFTEIVPVMSECFNIRFESDHSATAASERLARLRIDGAAALFIEQRRNSLYAGCSVKKLLSIDAILSMDDGARSAPFYVYFYQIDGIKSGMHHPDGMLWIRQPDRKHRLHREKIPLTAIAPMILNMFSVAAPEYMLTKVAPKVSSLPA
jgi:hypothetical protein